MEIGLSVNEFMQRGYLLEKGFYPTSLIDELKRSFDVQFEEKKKRFYSSVKATAMKLEANHDKHRWNMLLESNAEILCSEFYAHPKLFDFLQRIFEGDFALVFLSSDISSPGSSFQTIHQDGNDFAIALNVPLVDSNEHNGSTEVFPNTHRISKDTPFSRNANSFSDNDILIRVRTLSPIRLNLSKGDFTLRDLRLIHRGTPNHTTTDRPYLSAIFMTTGNNEAPSFEAVSEGLDLFQRFKKEAFASGRVDLIDFANTFGRSVMAGARSDRVARHIPKSISDQLSEQALYCLRFARFEDESINKRVTRTVEASEALRNEYKLAVQEFEVLKKG